VNFQNLALTIDRAPHVHLPSRERDHHFIQMPPSVTLRTDFRRFLAITGPNLSTQRRIASLLTMRQEILNIAVA
jgi:hypothetical protein